MKPVYNSTWLHNLQTCNRALLWFKQRLISEEEKNNVLSAHPVGFYRPGFWLALGLFFFTTILLLAASGLVSFLLYSSGVAEGSAFQVVGLLFSTTCLFLSDYYKRRKNYLHAGTDNALLWAGLGTLITNVFISLLESDVHEQSGYILGFLFSSIICFAATLLYADVFVALALFVNWFFFVASVCVFAGDSAKPFLPFIGFLNAAGLYLLVKWKQKDKSIYYYNDCFQMLEAATLLTAYMCLNYFVVREMTQEMFGFYLEEGQDIPLAGLFYFFTVALPICYIAAGLWRKDRILIRIGLLLVVAAVFTIRQYHSVLPIEKALTLAGLLMVGLSYTLIRYLKTPQKGFTYEEQEEQETFVKAESLIVAQTFGKELKTGDAKFGGGDFGGGGASNGY